MADTIQKKEDVTFINLTPYVERKDLEREQLRNTVTQAKEAGDLVIGYFAQGTQTDEQMEQAISVIDVAEKAGVHEVCHSLEEAKERADQLRAAMSQAPQTHAERVASERSSDLLGFSL